MSSRPRPNLTPSGTRRVGWKLNVIAALVSTSIALLGVEMLVRVFEGRSIKKWTDRPTLYFMPSSATDMGDRAYESTKPTDAFRISVVGDSFTFGPRMQLEDTFSKRLEHWLNLNQQIPKVEVINRGVSGTATRDQVALVRKELQGNPDVIFLEITLNDAEDHLLTPQEKEKEFGGASFDTPILRNIHLLRFIFSRLNNAESRRAYVKYHSSAFEKPETFRPFKAALESISKDCKDAGVRLFAVVFPMFDFPFDNRYPFEKTHEIIHTALQGANIQELDLLSAYDGIPNEHLLVVPGVDNHPNEIAHRIAAERILLYMRKNKLIPPGAFPSRTYKHRQNMREKQMKFRGKQQGEQPEEESIEQALD